MYQKTVERQEGYSKEQISRLKKHFAELAKARRSRSVLDYVKKVEAKLKA